MIRHLLLGILIFTAAPAHAEQIDRACSNHQGMSNLNPFGANALNALNKCVKLYCGPKVKVENTRDNIKFIDETLQNYHTRIVAYSEAIDQYQKSCRELMKKFCLACPLSDAVNNAIIKVQNASKGVDESAAILRQQNNFTDFAGIVSRDENDLACGSQITSDSSKEVALHHSNTHRFANTMCDKK